MTDREVAGAPPASDQDTKTDDNAASSSAATDAAGSSPENAGASQEPTPSLLDAVQSALKEEKAEGDAVTPTAESVGKGTEAGASPADPAKKPDADKAGAEDADIPKEFHKHPAWQRLLTERNDARKELEGFKPDAEQYRKIEQFRTNANLTPQEVVEGYQVMALIKNDPFKALAVMQGYVDQLQGMTGGKLPPDLQEKVRTGHIDRQTAEQLSRERARGQFNETQLTSLRQRQQQEDAARQQQQLSEAIKGTVGQWEAGIAQKDPDYERKQPMVQDRIWALAQQHGIPRTQQDALALAQQAYKDVNAYLSGLMPQGQMRALPAATGSTQPAPPANLEEAVRRAVGQ